MSWLFPQIPRPDAEQLIDLFNADPASRRFSGLEHPQRFYQASGGDRLPDDELEVARAAIRAIAKKSGFPDQPPTSSRNQAYASFEAAVAEWFAGWVVLDVERPGITAENIYSNREAELSGRQWLPRRWVSDRLPQGDH